MRLSLLVAITMFLTWAVAPSAGFAQSGVGPRSDGLQMSDFAAPEDMKQAEARNLRALQKAVEDAQTIYLSHTIVQLFPVPYRTKNCVSLVAEFATTDAGGLTERFRHLLERYTLSEKTGMAVYTGFTPSEELLAYGRKVKRGEIEPGVLGNLADKNLKILLDGRGIIGAVAAIPFYTRYEEALELCSGQI